MKAFSLSLVDPNRVQVTLLDGDFRVMYSKDIGYADVKNLETNQADCLINELNRLFDYSNEIPPTFRYDYDFHSDHNSDHDSVYNSDFDSDSDNVMD